ncbi:hypothetical protein BJY16_005311 [Actinoplanes octamycinicus]|uniref:Uncharacterized protein n=1 Tax=Actinoplanes octamycinicus TaxID=135948 RepID=A0A7W7H0X5_9ACTN|nr:hypothetical protein [Actinoplanes octamycinicus]MBB4741852.1 hypothetical protein [Actinoplanes octamycinicus]GIE60616.1 hypothetical protein Aoc01nite_60180 [Actinoplanes octamycinicus]
MQPSLSHADLVSGAIFLRLGGADPLTADLLAAAAADPASPHYKNGVLLLAWEPYRSLLAHEWAHVLQVASYPYLFLRAARHGRVMIGISVALEAAPGEYPIPLPFRLDEQWSTSSVLSQLPVRVEITEDGVAIEPVDPGLIARGVVTELDLLEEDAQIFQYRAEIGARGNGRSYRRWSRERPRYERLFLLCARHLGTEPAYRALPVFVRLAFRTTRPLRAFFTCLAVVLKYGPDDLTGWDTLPTLESILQDQLVAEFGLLAADAVSMDHPEVADVEGVLPPDALAVLRRRGRQLPASVLTGMEIEDGVVSEFLTEPWRFLPRGGNPTPAALRLMPPLLVVELVGADFPVGSTVLALSPELRGSSPIDVPGASYLDWTPEIYRTRSVWKAVAAGARGPHPRCPHTACRVHRTGLCHGWFPFPADFEDCRFRPFLRHTTKHDVAADGTHLVPVPAGTDDRRV